MNSEINEISWLFQALKEKINIEEKICFPVYRYINIVFTNDFSNYEASFKNSKKLIQTILNKYSFLLRKGILDITNIKKSVFPYIIRIEKNLNFGMMSLMNIENALTNRCPNEIRQIIFARRETLKLFMILRKKFFIKMQTTKNGTWRAI